MPGDGQHIDRDVLNIYRNLACGLHGIRMENSPVLAAHLGYFRYRENNARFIVRPHRGNHLRP